MKDNVKKLRYRDKDYTLVFNLNVMERIQEEYGSLDRWTALTDGSYDMEKRYEAKNGSLDGFDVLTDEQKAEYIAEPNIAAVRFGVCEMLNEGIEIENENNGEDQPPLSLKTVGRMLTELGLANVTSKMQGVVIDSTATEEKN